MNDCRAALLSDAGYCAAIGTGAMALSRPVARTVAISAPVVVAAGAGTVAWAGLLTALARRPDVCRTTRAVSAVNLGAAAALACFARSRSRHGSILVTIIAGHVAGFGVVQMAHGWRRR